MKSLAHVVGRDGDSDRIVSESFLVGWMADSVRIACARDGYAAISSLSGKLVAEFGDPLDAPDDSIFGIAGLSKDAARAMRHAKSFRAPVRDFSKMTSSERIAMATLDYGEDAAFSPDGKWFGPRYGGDQWEFLDSDGHKINLKAPAGSGFRGSRAVWSPDGAHVIVLPVSPSGSFPKGNAIEPRHAFVIDFREQKVAGILELDQVPPMGDWDYRKGRWNPWSRDGSRLAFIRQGQVWTSDPDGGNARQTTFDGSNKAFPTFSRDGSKIAYATWQFDTREHYLRLGPTDLWVVDCASGLAARVTHPDAGRIEGLDWLDDATLIYDRVAEGAHRSSLKTVSLR